MKLADSGIAPLVAAARSYRTLNADNCMEQTKAMGVRSTTKQGHRLKMMCGVPGRDALQLPWYTATSIQSASASGLPPVPFTFQIRPQVPQMNNGWPVEYESIDEGGLPIGVHPATPASWIDTTPVIMIVEGMMHADSVLTAQLWAGGVASEALAYTGDDSLERLRALMESIAPAQRVLIVEVADLRTLRGEIAAFREIKLRGREAWIVPNSDPATERGLRSAAGKLARALSEKGKMEPVRFANLSVTDEDGDIAWVPVSDYMTRHNGWAGLTEGLEDDLWSAPEGTEKEIAGAVRVASDGCSVERYSALRDGPGGTTGSHVWTKEVELGGYITALEDHRQPTEREVRTGVFDTKARAHNADDSMVEVKVSWAAHGAVHSALVKGPVTILSYPPEDWVRQKAMIPTDLLRHPSWPPRAAKGQAWLAAVKAHRSAETTQRTSWEQMGWVPVEGGEPVFLIGDQILGEISDGAAVCGIDERDVPTMPMFGIGDMLEGDLDDPEYRETVRKDFRDVIDAYITSGAWTEKGTAALVLGAALRPVIPLRPRATVFLWGPKGKGKSWTAKTMMYFWARRRANWQDQLPGSAKDTVAYIEHCVARTPIWVVDDLAPSPVKRQAESEDGKLADLTRSIFNNATKGRMNADMSSRKVNKPIAQLVITAENELTTPSAKERLIPAYLGHGKLSVSKEPTTRLNTMSKEDGTQARFTSHLLRYVRHKATTTPGGWEAYYGRLEDMRSTVQGQAEKIMSRMGATAGSLERTSSLAADILITFELLDLFARELDMEDEFTKVFHIKDGIGMDLITLVCNAHVENLRSSPGTSLVRALSALLASGGAHVISGQDPSKPPIQGTDADESMANHRLGWSAGNGQDGALRPNGPTIGTVVMKGGQQVIAFHSETAFARAQEAYPKLIQHGQGTGSAGASVWDEGLTPSVVARRTVNGKTSNTLRMDLPPGPAGERRRVEGVPIGVDLILAGDATDQDEGGAAA
jgi:hypothetical protein